MVVPYFPSTISYLPMLVSLLSPPTSPSTSTTPSTPHHPLISSPGAWELRAVLLLWLALLLTVPFNLSALSSDCLPASVYGVDLRAQEHLFASPLAPLAKQVMLLSLLLLHRPGKEGAYASLVLARLLSRRDVVHSIPGFLTWAGTELEEGDRESEANFVASLLELLAVLPTLIAPEHLDLLRKFMDDVLLPHLRGSLTAASSGLVRKLAVKAKGRWWSARMTGSSASDGLPDGLEEQLDTLMGGLSDKVSKRA